MQQSQVRPKQPIKKENMIKDLLGFKVDKINQWMEQGYEDAKRCIGDVSKVLQLQVTHKSVVENRNRAITNLNSNFYID
jgi:NTE family protein